MAILSHNRNLTIKSLILYILFSLNIQFSHCQEKALAFENFLIEDGLASVNCILKDQYGFMWFGGTHGLYRYDGYKFKTFLSDENKPYSLSNNNVVCLYEDKDGLIWVGTMHGGINIYDPKTESFTNNKNRSKNALFDEFYITCITEDADQNIWIGTFGNGIIVYNKVNESVKKFEYDNQNVNSISNNSIFSIAVKNNKIWITSDTGILDCFYANINTFKHYTFSNKKYQSTRTGQRICFDSFDNIWIATEEEGVFKFNMNSKSFQHFQHSKNKTSISSNVITDIKEGLPGEIWMTTEGGGLNLINSNNNNQISTYQNDPVNSKSISNNSSYCLFIDSKSDLWLGLGNGSVCRTISSPFEVYQSSLSNSLQNLSFNVVVSLFQDEDQIWIGTGGGGLNKFNIVTDKFTHFKHDQDIEHSIPSNTIMNVIVDGNGTVWTGNFKNGVSYMPKGSNSFYKPLSNHDASASLANSLVFDLAADKDGNIWIATFDKGLYKYVPKTNKIAHYSNFFNHSKFQTNKLLRILIDSNGTLWLGYLNGEILTYHSEKNTFSSLKELGFDEELSIQNPIKDIYENNNGEICVATEGSGVYFLNVKTKTYKELNKSDGLPTNSVYGLIQDENNDYWMSTNKGIVSYGFKTNRISVYNTFHGLPTNDFESGAIAKSPAGKLYFGSKKGLIAFYPKQLKRKSTPINLMLTNFRIFNNDVAVYEKILDHTPLTQSISFSDEISLPYYLDNISFEFAVPGHSTPHDIQYEYLMDNLDERWIKTSSDHNFANYSNIPPGKYTFRVKAINENKLENDYSIEKSIDIKISPVWWQTRLAYFIYFLLGTVVIYIVYYNIKNRVRLKNELLIEKYKHEKDEELHKAKINFFTTISHELRTSLTLILSPIQELYEIKSNNNRTANLIMTMNRNGHRLYNLINQILDFRKMESGTSKLKVSQIKINDFFTELCMPFLELAHEKNIKFTLTVSNNCELGLLDTNKLEIAVFNILSNAFKFTKSKIDLNVDLDENDETLIIKIKDNGIGISEINTEKIFENFYQINDLNSSTNKGTGLGLAITKNLVQVHKGKITVNSKLNKFTLFTINIPIKEKFYSREEIYNIESETENISDVITKDEDKLAPIDLPKSSINSQKPVLLIIEDNFEVRNLIKSHFIDSYKVIAIDNGKDGLNKALEVIPDIIISDIMMPKMNGLELCKHLKTDERTSHIPILILTARSSHTFKIEGFEYGADDYITKPFDINLLKIRIGNLIESRMVLQKKFSKEVILKPRDIAINNIDEVFLEKIISTIENNMSDANLSVEFLAKEIGMSHSVLYRKIKALTGKTINDFIKSIRLARAAQLILKSSYSIYEISDITGFSNPKYFSTCFKKVYNVSPSKFKNTQ